nr:MAG TPA: hypothetical protein [Caudoviricetes sp.]
MNWTEARKPLAFRLARIARMWAGDRAPQRRRSSV